MPVPTNSQEIVLIVDDELAIRNLLHSKLSREGYTCLAVAGSSEAVDAIQGRRVALVLLDVNMPGKS